MSRIWHRLVGPALLTLAIAGVVGGCGRRAEEVAGEADATPVSVVPIRVASVLTSEDVEVPGTVKPIREARVGAKIMSKVARVTVNEGDRVSRGELLIKLDDSDLRAQAAQAAAGVDAARAGRRQAQTALEMQRVASDAEVEQARAQLRIAQANLEKVTRGPRPEQRGQAAEALAQAQAAHAAALAQLDLVREGARRQQRAQAAEAVTAAQQAVEAATQQVVAAEAAARTAEADYNRMKALADQDVIPGQRLDHAALQLDSARAQLAQARAGQRQAQAGLEQARQQLSLVEEGPRTQEVQQAEQAVAQAAAGVEQARLELRMADSGGRPEDVASARRGHPGRRGPAQCRGRPVAQSAPRGRRGLGQCGRRAGLRRSAGRAGHVGLREHHRALRRHHHRPQRRSRQHGRPGDAAADHRG